MIFIYIYGPTRTETRTHTCVNPRSSLAWWMETRESPSTGVWFCLKSSALFIVIKVPLTIPPLLESPQPYIILISTESRTRGWGSYSRLGWSQRKRESRVSRLCQERKSVLWSRVVFRTVQATCAGAGARVIMLRGSYSRLQKTEVPVQPAPFTERFIRLYFV